MYLAKYPIVPISFMKPFYELLWFKINGLMCCEATPPK